jgi:hypothetical protein
VELALVREGVTMLRGFKELDRILRGEATRSSSLAKGKLDISIGDLWYILLLMGMFYGLCMGCKAGGTSFQQLLATTLKVPALFFFTLAITFPSLYVFNALVGSRLSIDTMLRLLCMAMAVMLTVLASLGLIVAFFAISTTSYAFMKLVNVVVFGVSGSLGLSFLLQTLQRLSTASPTIPPTAETGSEVEGPTPGALEPVEGQVLGSHVKAVFRCWVILFGLVGAQMGWVLRPFIGSPDQPFEWFRRRNSNIFEGVWQALTSLFS